MAIKRPKPEETIEKLRRVDVLMGQGMPRIDATRQISVTELTSYRWKKKYGGMGTDQLTELERLQKENERLRRAGSELTLDISDEHSRECLAIRVQRRLNSTEVIDALTGLFILRGIPAFIRSDNDHVRPSDELPKFEPPGMA